MVDFKFYDVTDWTTNNYNTRITQYIKKLRQSGNEIWSVNKILRNFFLQKSYGKWGRENSSRLLFVFLKKLYVR